MTGAAPFSGPEPLERSPVPSFDEIYELYFDFVWRSLRRLGVAPSVLDDATQEVFLVVHRRLSEFEARSSLKTWIFGIVWNIAQRSNRSAPGRRVDATELPEPVCDRDSPQEQVASREAIRLLYAILDELDAELRAVFVMAELEELTAPEIAEITGTPLNTVYSRLRAARRDFDACLKRLRARTRWRQP